ncbi:Flp family type IVb pilin [Desulfovibrio sp. TomC]|uniref:Flp family type IVb pilin n=1 Tax=Desulfovibrio sp. TomC TaxID=1562888 RepID=UPI000573CE88|nr:Flp family type IVb pilin [Desulfovibrio sp. TomC]KHK02590.1 Flp pilus assembly protein, pilin Flp [Desulfovibrio sp. TomC]
MPPAITRFIRDETGATAVEYGLMVALISTAILVVVTAIGVSMATIYQRIADTISP